MNQIDLKGRTVVVTGGAKGIGYAVVERALRSGAAVALWDMDESRAQQSQSTLEKLGPVTNYTVDVQDETSVAEATARTVKMFGSIDVLVNNAGITGRIQPLWEIPPSEWQQVLGVNLTGAYLTSRSIVPVMLKQGYGRIINIASIAGKEGNPNASHYSASKAGLIGLTKSLAKELATRNILVNAVTPGAAETELLDALSDEVVQYMRSKIPMNRFVRVEEVSALVVWLASEECSVSTGAVFDASGGRATY
ncbi:SDR family NAD(P)-dependent oxidoreductase [Paraburkholderia youngii]|uniref:3-oxoacyl-[acyl-carrier protein] reductase n=1 Tax=Paraburkholderia youngii TaxID=2782701 RepID=A0A7W8P5K3_9BURK|nr:SDR family NAD(P)-dependent oxidoreductase [Paraburkholderia youngii]MBB5404461.1 3-oxoacyl-[acyl-carrier protein] reductase [Paraburkholderia youngii]